MNRRNFLATRSALAAASFVPYYALGAEKRYSTAEIGAIGLGLQGCGNARSLNPLVDIVALCDLDTEYMVSRLVPIPVRLTVLDTDSSFLTRKTDTRP